MARDPASRLPAHDLDAEEAVLASVLWDGRRIDDVRDVLGDGDWYAPGNRAIWRACCAVADRGEAIDALTVRAALDRAESLALAGGQPRLLELLGPVPVLGGRRLGDAAERVRQLAQQRHLVTECHTIAAEGYDALEDVPAWVDGAEARVAAVAAHRRIDPARVSIRDAVRESLEIADAARARKGITGLPTGLTLLDRQLAGLHPGQLVVVAARPGMGKSSLGAQWARHATRSGVPALVASYEMPRAEITTRLLCADTGVDMRRVRAGETDPWEITSLCAAGDVLAQEPLFVDDRPPLDVLGLRGAARRIDAMCRRERGRGIGLVVVDYLQLMGGALGRGESREHQVSMVSRSLKALAREMSVPVVALSQLNRQCESRADKRPMLSDLRESGAIEQDADVVIFVYRGAVYGDKTAGAIAELIVAKQRSGPVGVVPVEWLGARCAFKNSGGDAR